MHSIFQIDKPDIHVLYASFADSLQGPTHSGNFYLGEEQIQLNLQVLQSFDDINHYSSIRKQLSGAQRWHMEIKKAEVEEAVLPEEAKTVVMAHMYIGRT
ncbi:hypothetical protein Moror_9900 [Moniliophthora roreri MCA 2997]|uniref:Uncharacterized protein n=1 Tax=Moniliophthora roreri (strain MCA 2997) TaxID=1381753 RepID=V2WVV4_MONRO|nr:hypothetical protein Moror_9900 [Moniliophthora roreri MCA 2997]